MNDLNYFVSNTSLRLYADDRTEYAFEPSPMVLQYVINSDLSVLSTGFEPNYVKIDAPKTQAEYDFHFNNRTVETQDTLKILGLILHRKMNFKAHIKKSFT